MWFLAESLLKAMFHPPWIEEEGPSIGMVPTSIEKTSLIIDPVLEKQGGFGALQDEEVEAIDELYLPKQAHSLKVESPSSASPLPLVSLMKKFVTILAVRIGDYSGIHESFLLFKPP